MRKDAGEGEQSGQFIGWGMENYESALGAGEHDHRA